MVFHKKISCECISTVRYWRLERGLSTRKVAAICGVSQSTVLRCTRSNPKAATSEIRKPGRPKKINMRQERALLRSLTKLRRAEGGFTSRRIMKETGISPTVVSDRTVRRVLNKNGYYLLQARKKGLMSERDMKIRLDFARMMKKYYKASIWTEHIAFYLDGVSFAYKRNPLDQARAPSGRVWRKRSEGLMQGCLSKGKKEGTGGKYAKFFVAITYQHGVILCEQYDKLDGKVFEAFIDKHFPTMFERAKKGDSRLWLQDGDPSQNSACAKAAMCRVNCELLNIPARSPDLNPIENLFNMANDILRKDALSRQIRRESYEEFSQRVYNTLTGISTEYINKTIQSMDKRINLIIEKKGQRIKY